jgi:hypothetical protein
MEYTDKVKAILHIRPNAEFVMRDDVVEWLDTTQKEPTKKEIEAGLISYNLAKKAETDAKETAKAAILDRIGLTADEAKLLLG